MQRTMLIKTEAQANSNKFYEVTLDASQRVTVRFGRVGATGTTQTIGTGLSVYHRQIAKKEKRGYRRADVVGTSAPAGAATDRDTLREAGRKALAGSDPVLTDLVDMLVSINAHDIDVASGGKIAVSATGGVSTPLGPLSASTVVRARNLLAQIENTSIEDRTRLLNDYLMLVPQKVPAKRGWAETFFEGFTTFRAQNDLLDQLEASVRFVTATENTDSESADFADAFRYRLAVLDDDRTFAKINAAFGASVNDQHQTARSTLQRVYVLTDTRGDDVTRTQSQVGNVRSMWHGSRASNVLSILSGGMVVPPQYASHTTGRMFGDGLYFSEQSTKSLNYGRGGLWSSGTDSRHFMFRCEVAMGRECRPNLHGIGDYNAVLAGRISDPKTGQRFDSINVKAGTCGVRNHEAIVGRPEQVRLGYLCEFA